MTTDIKERPILFSGEMVRAILDGRKTQTRRIVKPQPCPPSYVRSIPAEWQEHESGRLFYGFIGEGCGENWECPYGSPGDRLWVRETWTPDHAAFYPHFPVFYRADGVIDYERNDRGEVYSPEQDGWYPFRWRPSIHMPRWASRLALEVTGVRIERLQEITEHDAWLEGCHDNDIPTKYPTSVAWFHSLWESINGSDSWSMNPFVWVIEFRRVQP